MRATGVRARVRTGHPLIVIDVSPDGALVEAGRPLRPGSQVELHVESDRQHARFAARVVRCDVVAISADYGTTYRAGLSFNEPCAWVCEHATPRESEVPGHDAERGSRVAVREKEIPADLAAADGGVWKGRK
jgi:hypothetical protein